MICAEMMNRRAASGIDRESTEHFESGLEFRIARDEAFGPPTWRGRRGHRRRLSNCHNFRDNWRPNWSDYRYFCWEVIRRAGWNSSGASDTRSILSRAISAGWPVETRQYLHAMPNATASSRSTCIPAHFMRKRFRTPKPKRKRKTAPKIVCAVAITLSHNDIWRSQNVFLLGGAPMRRLFTS